MHTFGWIIFSLVLHASDAVEKNSETPIVAQGTAAVHRLCYREETYYEFEKLKSIRPVKVRTVNWCLSVPPRCSTYHTEMKEVYEMKNLTKTRVVEHCCAGFVEIKGHDNTECKPNCERGCGHGVCHSPDFCVCNFGYTGPHCLERCPYGFWGENCRSRCQCQNGAICDHRSGQCHCTPGWIGDLCNLPCPNGLFGPMCKLNCDCLSIQNLCDSETGECRKADDQIFSFDWTIDRSNKVTKSPISHHTPIIAPNQTNTQPKNELTIQKTVLLPVHGNADLNGDPLMMNTYKLSSPSQKFIADIIMNNTLPNAANMSGLPTSNQSVVHDEFRMKDHLNISNSPISPLLGNWQLNAKQDINHKSANKHDYARNHHDEDSKETVALITIGCLLLAVVLSLLIGIIYLNLKETFENIGKPLKRQRAAPALETPKPPVEPELVTPTKKVTFDNFTVRFDGPQRSSSLQ